MEKELISNDKKYTDLAHKLLRDSNIQDFEMDQLTGHSRLDALDHLSPEDLVLLIKDEELSVQALVLAHLDAKKSFQTLEELPLKMRSQLLATISKLGPTPPKTLEQWNLKFRKKLLDIENYRG